MVNSKGCSLTEAFGDGFITKKKKKPKTTEDEYKENGKILDYIPPKESKSKDTVDISNNMNIKTSQKISSDHGKIINSNDSEEINILKERIKIYEKENKDLQDFNKTQLNKYIKIHGNRTEHFANFNDDFNDVLIFALVGFFYLIFTDYVYKLGKKSY